MPSPVAFVLGAVGKFRGAIGPFSRDPAFDQHLPEMRCVLQACRLGDSLLFVHWSEQVLSADRVEDVVGTGRTSQDDPKASPRT